MACGSTRNVASLIIVFAVTLSASVFEYCIKGDIPVLGIRPAPNINPSIECLLYCPCNNNSTPPAQPLLQGTPTSVPTLIKGIQYLDDFSLHSYQECIASKQALLMAHNQKQCHEHRSFLNRTTPIVGLVSFPGSGNSWVRHILEQSTGIFTGSIYCDSTLKASFPGEYVVSGNVLAVKTHHCDSTYLPKKVQEHTRRRKFSKAILIVRNPYDALVSEANRQWSKVQRTQKHHGLAHEEDFIGNPKWDWFVEYKGFQWYMMLTTWLKHSDIPVHVVQYEKLKANLTEEVVKMTDFLNQNISDDTLQCVLSNNQGLYRRQKHLNFDPFSERLKITTNQIIKKGNAVLKKYSIQYETR